MCQPVLVLPHSTAATDEIMKLSIIVYVAHLSYTSEMLYPYILRCANILEWVYGNTVNMLLVSEVPICQRNLIYWHSSAKYDVRKPIPGMMSNVVLHEHLEKGSVMV